MQIIVCLRYQPRLAPIQLLLSHPQQHHSHDYAMVWLHPMAVFAKREADGASRCGCCCLDTLPRLLLC